MKKTIWISYDFGMKGDFENLYSWLDKNKAVERGYGLALISNKVFPIKINNAEEPDKELIKYLKNEIRKIVSISNSDRIYLIWTGIKDSKPKGAFLFGSQKANPWQGYSNSTEEFSSFDGI